jgi:hypothetical protein
MINKLTPSDSNSKLLWIIIFVGILILGTLSYKLVGDMKKQSS